MRPPHLLLCLLIFSLTQSEGCAMFNQDKYYLYNGSVYDRANVKPRDGTQVTDKDALGFSNDVKTALRQKMNWARIARLTSGTVQVFTAAAAAALGAASGSITAVAALAASSAVMPEVQNIFEAKERAEAYQQGVALIEEAEVRYFKTVGGTINNQKFTPAGADFYFEVLASLKLVEKALVAQLPTIEELQKATGKFNQIEIVPNSLTILKTAKEKISITSGGPAKSAVSDNPVITGAHLTDGNMAVEVEGKAVGSASLTILNNTGGVRTVEVKVTEPVDLAISPSKNIKGKAGQPLTFTLTVTNKSPSSVASDVIVSVTLPAELTGVKAQGTSWSCSPAQPSDPLICKSSVLAFGDGPAIIVTALALPNEVKITGVATIKASQTDPDMGNNTVNLPIEIEK